MAVELPNVTETHDAPHSVIQTDVLGLEEVYKLVEDTQRVLGTMSTFVQLTDGTGTVDASDGILLSAFHIIALEYIDQLAASDASMKQRIEELERRIDELERRTKELEHDKREMNRRLEVIEQKLEKFGMQVEGWMDSAGEDAGSSRRRRSWLRW